MPSSFMGLYVQREALLAAQKALDITGNNLSNLETEGYVRQRVDLASVPNNKNILGYNSAIGLAGRGSEIVGVAQVRDALIDTKFRNYTSEYSNSNMKTEILSQLEDALDNLESEDTGFMSVLASLKSGLQGYSSDNADRRELGTIVMNNARSVADMIRALDSRITDISKQTLSEAQHAAKTVNTTLSQLASLNASIKDAYINMGYIELSNNNYIVQGEYGPLELKDEFHRLADSLSEYGEVSVNELDDGSFTVTLAGRMVVSTNQYAQIAFRDNDYDIPTAENLTDEQRDELANPNPTDLQLVVLNAGVKDPSTGKYSGLKNQDEWNDLETFLYNMGKTKDDFLRGDGDISAAFDIYSADPLIRKVSEKWGNHQLDDITDAATGVKSGSIRGLIDLYNGKGTYAIDGENAYEGIEYFRGLINSFAKTFADTLNGIYNSGDHAYAGFPGVDSQVLFTYTETGLPGAPDGIAGSIAVSDFWQQNAEFISNPDGYDESSALDNSWINKMIGAFNVKHAYAGNASTYAFEDFVSHYGNELGNRIQYETKLSGTSEVMLLSVTDIRDSVMGVSVDEEGINMMNYQKWYNAIARMTTTMDEALDKLINGTGRVGL
jgi:flagellar hook-associated protein 1 FlgK